MLEPKIEFQDDYVLIINKPSGWIVNEASTTGDTPVLQTWLKENYTYEISQSKEFRSGIVHRIDKETSGILIVAKEEAVFRTLQSQFKQREVKKKYIALLHGELVPEEGSVTVPVGRLPWNRERFGVLPGGKKAKSIYKVISIHKRQKEKFSLVEFSPITGRTHQIRIHAKYLNHPIVADPFYAGRKTSRRDRKWCPRLFLHAWKISFRHPGKKKFVEYTADLHSDLKNCIDGLEKLKENK